MNVLDRAISWFAPSRGLQRARARYAMRIYDGAQPGRRAQAWRTRATAANTEIANAIRPLRDRARELVRNTPHASRALDIITSHAVGTGLVPVSHTGSDGTDKRVIDLWNEWQEEADVEGMMSFAGMQGLAVRSMIESGEVVLRFVDTDRDMKSGVPLQLQLLEGDFIDQWREGIYAISGTGLTPDTKRSRLGVGLGDYDRRTGLWLFGYHPGEMTYYNVKQQILSSFVPLDQLCHVYRILRPGQVRGVPWFAPVLTTTRDLADYLDAVTVKARVEACFTAFVLNSDEFDKVLTTDTASSANADFPVTTLEPGMIQELKAGQDIKFAQPSGTSQIEPMLLFNLMAIAAGVGCTYDQLTGDLRMANYSSLRAGKLDFRKLIEQVQEHCIIPMMCKRVWDRFISRAILANKLQDRSGGYPVSWVTPAWEAINPRFDLDAEMLAVRAGRMSPQNFIGSWGYDWRTVINEWAEFSAYCKERGVVLDLDPSVTSQGGSFQSQPTAPAAGTPGAPPGKPGATKPNGKAPDQLFDADGNAIDTSGTVQ